VQEKVEAERREREAVARQREAADRERAGADRRAAAERERAGGEAGRAADRRPDGPRGDVENKLRHVEQAIGHLKEAGMPDMARNLEQEANRLRASLRGGEGDRPRDGDRPREETRRDEPRRAVLRPDGDIEALRREIQELRQAVRQLSEK